MLLHLCNCGTLTKQVTFFGGRRQKISMCVFVLKFTLGKRSISGKRNAETGLFEEMKGLVKM